MIHEPSLPQTKMNCMPIPNYYKRIPLKAISVCTVAAHLLTGLCHSGLKTSASVYFQVQFRGWSFSMLNAYI